MPWFGLEISVSETVYWTEKTCQNSWSVVVDFLAILYQFCFKFIVDMYRGYCFISTVVSFDLQLKGSLG